MSKIKTVFRTPRVWIVIIFLAMALIAISPNPFASGLVIKAVERNSSASLAGLDNPGNVRPSSLEHVLTFNGKTITNFADWTEANTDLPINRTVTLRTDKDTYRINVLPILETTVLNETEIVNRTITETINGTEVNRTITEEIPLVKQKIIGAAPIGITVADTPQTNLRKGLELQGGVRVLMAPEEEVSEETFDMMIDSMKQRLNAFGLQDIVITKTSDLAGNDFILVELAGETEQQARDLLSKQGKFEAKIGDDTVFRGGEDITYVCRTAQCSGIDPNRGCFQVQGGYSCSYFFTISLSSEAAQRQADLTRNLDVEGKGDEAYLSQNLTMFLDDQLMRELRIGASLRGQPSTQIQISGFGNGINQQEAMTNTLDDMKQLQTILITGSLPAKITIFKVDTISPSLGESFTKNALFMGLMAVLAVVVVLMLRYRRIILAIPIMLTSLSEITLTIGLYALFGWSFDLAAIAGIIVAVGMGVNDQIIITDEALAGERDSNRGWKDSLKKAFFIILAAAGTTVAAMLPLYALGAGMLKGFAITTIWGLLFGIVLTRPAYGKLVEILLSK